MMKMVENSIMTIELKDYMSEKTYCKRCGALHNSKFQIQLSPKRLIAVCTSCFEWARNKTPTEIKKDYKKKPNT